MIMNFPIYYIHFKHIKRQLEINRILVIYLKLLELIFLNLTQQEIILH